MQLTSIHYSQFVTIHDEVQIWFEISEDSNLAASPFRIIRRGRSALLLEYYHSKVRVLDIEMTTKFS